jgi:hypothetical protein
VIHRAGRLCMAPYLAGSRLVSTNPRARRGTAAPSQHHGNAVRSVVHPGGTYGDRAWSAQDGAGGG